MRALERAREALEEGRAGRALRLLPAAREVPAALRRERDLAEAEALRGQGYFGRSEALYVRLLRGRRADDPELWLEAALGSAAGLRSVGRAAEAAGRLDRAEALARRAAAWAFPRIELERALVARAQGRWEEALRRLGARLRGALAARDWQEASFLLWATAGARRFSGDLAGSRRDFERSLSLARRSGDAAAAGYAMLGLGGVTRIQGRLRASGAWYARARRAFAPTDDLFAKAYAECGLANSLRQQGRRREAERRYRAARRLYSRLGDPVDLAYVDWGLGALRLDEGRLEEAASALQRASRAFQAGRELRGECLSDLALAQAFHALGRTAEAERLFDRAVRRGRAGGLHAHLERYT